MLCWCDAIVLMGHLLHHAAGITDAVVPVSTQQTSPWFTAASPVFICIISISSCCLLLSAAACCFQKQSMPNITL
jgi:hypothetical protein